jgi:hypothetical protein
MDWEAGHRFPELETVLKVLYTAVTRAEQNLFFIETQSSVAGAALFRFLKQQQLAHEQEALEAQKLLTADEWVARGLDMALTATDAAAVDEVCCRCLHCCACCALGGQRLP